MQIPLIVDFQNITVQGIILVETASKQSNKQFDSTWFILIYSQYVNIEYIYIMLWLRECWKILSLTLVSFYYPFIGFNLPVACRALEFTVTRRYQIYPTTHVVYLIFKKIFSISRYDLSTKILFYPQLTTFQIRTRHLPKIYWPVR